jgi:hypothetical protein
MRPFAAMFVGAMAMTAGFTPLVTAERGGALVMLTQSFTDFMVSTFVPLLDSEIKTINIPDQNLGEHYEFNVYVRNIKVASLDLTDATIGFQSGKGLQLNIPFTIDVTADFEAQFAIWPRECD